MRKEPQQFTDDLIILKLEEYQLQHSFFWENAAFSEQLISNKTPANHRDIFRHKNVRL